MKEMKCKLVTFSFAAAASSNLNHFLSSEQEKADLICPKQFISSAKFGTYAFEQFYLVQGRFRVMGRALDDFEGDKLLVPKTRRRKRD
jgi:hypothetical protein